MNLLTSSDSLVLWRDTVRDAEKRCAIRLERELETYLVSLLLRYMNQPEIAKQVFARAILEAQQMLERERNTALQEVGDQCLLFAGLFPRAAERRHVKISYFVDIGKTAYATISQQANDLYGSLAMQFVLLMDVLQSIRPYHDLLPLEAYEQWNELGSRRALNILQMYTDSLPVNARKK